MAGYIDLENYECDGCRADQLGITNCGSCPENSNRIREWKRKYQNSNHETNIGGIFFED